MSCPSIDDGVPAERAPAARELLEVVLPHGGAALPEAVDVRDGAQVVEAVLRADFGRFPHRPFGRLAVAEQAVGPIVGPDAPRVQRAADGCADALAERTGRHVDKRQPRRRMPFEIGTELAQLEQLGAIECPGFGPGRVENRRGVPLRQDEAIAARVVRVFRIEPESRRRTGPRGCRPPSAAGRMTAAGFGCRAHRVDTQPGRNVGECRNEYGTIHVSHHAGQISEVMDWCRPCREAAEEPVNSIADSAPTRTTRAGPGQIRRHAAGVRPHAPLSDAASRLASSTYEATGATTAALR